MEAGAATPEAKGHPCRASGENSFDPASCWHASAPQNEREVGCGGAFHACALARRLFRARKSNSRGFWP